MVVDINCACLVVFFAAGYVKNAHFLHKKQISHALDRLYGSMRQSESLSHSSEGVAPRNTVPNIPRRSWRVERRFLDMQRAVAHGLSANAVALTCEHATQRQNLHAT